LAPAKFDQMPVGLLDRLRRISFFANKVADEIAYEQTEILRKPSLECSK